MAPVLSLGRISTFLFPPLWTLQTKWPHGAWGRMVHELILRQQWPEPTSSQGSQEQTHHHIAPSSCDLTQKAEEGLDPSAQVRKAHSCQGDLHLLL